VSCGRMACCVQGELDSVEWEEDARTGASFSSLQAQREQLVANAYAKGAKAFDIEAALCVSKLPFLDEGGMDKRRELDNNFDIDCLSTRALAAAYFTEFESRKEPFHLVPKASPYSPHRR
jgi:hypothetical protein